MLDAGCGKGRHFCRAAQFGAKDVIGVDLSNELDSAFERTRFLPNAHLVQADLHRLPFRQPFDYIYSIGVVHHLPDPEAGFRALVEHLRPGGRISVWVYGKEGNWFIEHLISPLRIGITSRLPLRITEVLAWILALPIHFAAKCIYGPVNRIRALAPLRKALFYNEYLFNISHFSFRENWSIIFDHLVAPTAFYVSHDELDSWFRNTSLKDTLITERNHNSWRGTGIKP